MAYREFHGSFRLRRNPAAQAGAEYGAEQRAVLSRERFLAAHATIAAWPGYAPTPLTALPGLAKAAGIGQLLYKDEAGRFGLGSFKALGGAYAVAELLRREVSRRTGQAIDAAGLLAGAHRSITRELTVCCATDGNHGRSVAWGARMLGCAAVVYLHRTVSAGRARAIEAFGARIVRTDGNYDDSVRRAQADADRHGWFVVSDTSYERYAEVPRDVMQGYAVMAEEAIQQLPDGRPPTHLFVQAGVGGLAAAVCGHFWETYGRERPRLVVVEPERAACVFESVAAGRPVAVRGALDTIMAGLACGEVSPLAWTILRTGIDAAMTVPDAAAARCMRRLAAGDAGDPPLVAGESAVTGLAGLLAVAADDDAREALGLGRDSRVLVFGTEGATDPELYARIVGRPADEVRERHGSGANLS